MFLFEQTGIHVCYDFYKLYEAHYLLDKLMMSVTFWPEFVRKLLIHFTRAGSHRAVKRGAWSFVCIDRQQNKDRKECHIDIRPSAITHFARKSKNFYLDHFQFCFLRIFGIAVYARKCKFANWLTRWMWHIIIRFTLRAHGPLGIVKLLPRSCI